MSLLTDLRSKVSSFSKEKYEISKTESVPSNSDSRLTFGNKGLKCEYAFLFVDIRKSSLLVTTYGYPLAAKIYQSFHEISCRIIPKCNGSVKAFDGDRIMGVFAGDRKRSNAVQCSMQIKWAIKNILNPLLQTSINFGAGIECGEVLISKVGIGGDVSNNDLIWIGKACNYASHLSNEAYNSVIISKYTYDYMATDVKYSNEKNMWLEKIIILKNGTKVNCYQSTWDWELS